MNSQLGGMQKWDLRSLERMTLQKDNKPQNILEEDIKASIIGLYLQTFTSVCCFKEKKKKQQQPNCGSKCKLKHRNHKNTYYGKQKQT